MNNPAKNSPKQNPGVTETANKSPKDIGSLMYTDLLPMNKDGFPETSEFLHRVVDIMLDFLKTSHDRSTKVLNFYHPSQLRTMLDLEIPDKPLIVDQLLLDCKNCLKYQVRTAHPHYFNQLSCGIDMVCLAGEWLTAAANTNMFTYEIAPVFILMEQVTMSKMREVIGFPEGDSILAPGGSISNLYAALVARHKMFPDVKVKGTISLQQLVMFTSEHSHYSISGAGMVMGIGMENVIEVPVDKCGRMIPEALEKCVIEAKNKGFLPFFVTATSGTTVVGAFDPINPIADICDKYDLWLHIDAAWGGGCMLSEKYKCRMVGVERAKSLTWNPHKQMGALLQCSTVHFSEDGLLFSCNQLSADYLFQQDKPYDVTYDTGDKVIQCGRHNDIFKLWLMWRSKGMEGYDKHITRLYDLALYMAKEIKKRGRKFFLIFEPECTNICYWYIPPSLQKTSDSKERRDKLGKITPIIKGRMMKKGSMMIGYQPQGDIPNFFRAIISSAAVTEEDIDFLLDETERLGKDL